MDVDAKIAREEGEVSLCGVKSEREREREMAKRESVAIKREKEVRAGDTRKEREREGWRKRGIKGETGMKRKRDSCRE